MTLIITADSLTLYAACVGTIALSVSAWVAFRDRARLIVSATPNIKITGPSEYDEDEKYDPHRKYFSISVANRGRRTRKIKQVGIKLRSTGNYSIFNDSIRKAPREVKEGDSVTYLTDQSEVNLTDIKYIYALDMTGRTYRKRFRTPAR